MKAKLLAKAAAYCDDSPPTRGLKRAWRLLTHRQRGRFAQVLRNAVDAVREERTPQVSTELLERLVPKRYLPQRPSIDVGEWMKQRGHAWR